MRKGQIVRKRSKARVVNGVISAVLVCFFAAHGAMGAASSVASIPHALAWLSWAGAVLACTHVAACTVTSAEQLTDTVRPPSGRKKRHLLVKWVTGAAVLVLVALHVTSPLWLGGGAGGVAVRALLTALLAAGLAVHMCFGAKSLLKDLGVDRRWRMAFRVAVSALAAVFALAVLAGAFCE